MAKRQTLLWNIRAVLLFCRISVHKSQSLIWCDPWLTAVVNYLVYVNIVIWCGSTSAVYNMNVTLTCSFSSPDSACSLEGTGSQIVPLLACNLDMTPHLLSLGVSSGQQRSEDENDNEVGLILNRAGYFVVTDEEKIVMTICPRHRKKLTTDWAGRKSNTCSYPTHRGPRKSIQKPRRVNATLSEEIYQIHHATVPIGSGKYKLCAARPQPIILRVEG